MDNTTIEFLPTPAGHASFIFGTETNECAYVRQIDPDERCLFVNENENCKTEIFYLFYIQFLFCTGGTSYIPILLKSVSLVLWGILLMILCIHISIMSYLPALLIMAKNCHMSEYIAGILLLSIGNAFGSVVNCFRTVEFNRLHLIEYLGSALFNSCFIAGIIIIIQPHTVVDWYFLRDHIYFLIAVAYMGFGAGTHIKSWYHIIFAFILYVIFVVHIFIHNAAEKKEYRRLSDDTTLNTLSDKERKRLEWLRYSYEFKRKQQTEFIQGGFRKTIALNNFSTTRLLTFEGRSANSNLFKDYFVFLIEHLKITVHSWWYYFALLFIIIAKILVILFLPIQNNALSRRGWCKLAVMINMFLFPVLIAVATFQLKYYYVYLPIGGLLSVIVFLTSRTDVAPSYQNIFPYLAFSGSIIFLFIVNTELKDVMFAASVVIGFDYTTSGYLFSSWGMCIGQSMASVLAVIYGYHHMGLAASYGTPLFRLMVAYHIRYAYLMFLGLPAYVFEGDTANNAATFLIYNAILMLFVSTLCNNQLRRSFGFYIIVCYVGFIFNVFLIEYKIVHGLGTDHNIDSAEVEKI